MMVAPKLVWFVIEDHDTGCNERPEFVGILPHKFVRFGHIGITITLRKVRLLENVIGVWSTPWIPKVASWGTRWARWARWAWWIVRPASQQARGPRGKVRGPAQRSRWWVTQWTRRWATQWTRRW